MPLAGMVRRSSRVLAGCVMAVLLASLTGSVGVRTASAASGWFNQNVTTPSPNFLVTAYDTTHHTVLAFDGTQTWTWSTSTRTWTAIPTVHVPATTSMFYAMTFDSTRGQAVMVASPFAISDNPTDLLTTWEFSGTDWAQRTPLHSPPARFGRSRSVAFDSRRGVTVLFSGQFANQFGPGDTWEWNGTDWTNRTMVPSPIKRDGHCLAYDSTRGVTVMFGGEVHTGSGGGAFSDTWEYDGTSWTRRDIAGIGPGSFAACNMVYDPVIGRMINFTTKSAPGSTTFSLEPFYWNSTSWVDANLPGPTAGPGPAAYDIANDTVVLDLQPVPAGNPQTWLLNVPPPPPPGWVNQNVTAPSPGAMTYDSTRHVILALDGSRTWSYDTASRTWTTIPTLNHPSAGGVNFAMTFDSARGKAVVVASPTPLGDPVTNFITTWEWGGTDWTQIVSAHTPLARSGFEQSLAYDAKRGVAVLFSGQVNGVPGDTWEWNGTDWTDRTTSSGPIGRQNQCLGYDDKRNVTVLYGGFENLGSSAITLTDTWEYDGTSWTLKASSGGPSSFNCSLTYDPALSRTIGLANKSVVPTSQALEPYYWDGASWVDTLLPGPGEDGFTAAYDPGSDAVVVDLFPLTTGGPETWLFNPSPAPPPGGGGGGLPVISSVSPNRGPTDGGTTVIIRGSNFTGAEAVSFRVGSNPLKPCAQANGLLYCFTVNSGSQITVISPPLDVGTSDVYVVTPSGFSANTPDDLYTYEGWTGPTPADKTAFDVPILSPPHPVTFSVKLAETDSALIGYTTLPDSVSCAANPNPGLPAQLDCTVSPLRPGLESVTFFDANNPSRVPTRTYIVGRGLYTAMGDSYSSGEGNPGTYIPPSQGPDNRCHRSTVAYGSEIAGSLYKGTFTFVACSGAIIKDAFANDHQGYPNEGHQLAGLGPQTDLVTISMGGNDIGFDKVATACLFNGWNPKRSAHCEYDQNLDNTTYSAMDHIALSGQTTQDTLDELYAAIKAGAPNARVLVLGYPRLAQTSGDSNCFGPNATPNILPADEATYVNQIAADIDYRFETAAARNKVEYVNAYEAFNGHELCKPDSYVNPADNNDATRENSLHPTPAGQAVFASLLQSRINQGPAGSQFLVKKGQKTITVTSVNPGVASVSFQFSWPGSDIAPSLVSPSGRTIDRSTTASDVIRVRGSNYEVVTINNPEAGQWTVGMTGVDVSPDGENALFNVVQVAPYNLPPQALMSTTVTAGTAPLIVGFDATQSFDRDGTIASYIWDFGDGALASGPTASHTYSSPGQYSATLTVTDNGGRQAYSSAAITVREGTRLTYTGPTRGDFNDPVTLSASLTSTLTGMPVPGAAVTFSAAGQSCHAVTDAAGNASCSITPTAAPGPGQVVVNSEATDRYAAATSNAVFTATAEESRLARPRSAEIQGPGGDHHGASVMLSSVLTTDGAPLAGKTVTFTLGKGAHLLSCAAVTSAGGAAACALNIPDDFGSHQLVASFAGDGYFAASSATAQGDGGDDRGGEPGRSDSR